MMISRQHQEYSARFGLKKALNDVETAQRIAEAKYRSLVGRDIIYSEMVGIHALIMELRNWVTTENTSQSICTH